MNVKADILSRWYALSASLTVVVGYTKSWSCSRDSWYGLGRPAEARSRSQVWVISQDAVIISKWGSKQDSGLPSFPC